MLSLYLGLKSGFKFVAGGVDPLQRSYITFPYYYWEHFLEQVVPPFGLLGRYTKSQTRSCTHF